MADWAWLWAVLTVIAAAAQTVRNAAQRHLTDDLGAVGATHVRFLFGLPFALIFLSIVLATGVALPQPHLEFLGWVAAGAAAQIAATAMMLVAMGERSFVVTIAYTKTEPVQVALFGLVALGDRLTVPMMAAIAIATAGVMAMSLKRFQAKWKPVRRRKRDEQRTVGANSDSAETKFAPRSGQSGPGGLRPIVLGLLAGAFFALAAVGFRGAILSLDSPSFVMAATFTLCVALALQAVLLSLYLRMREPAVLVAIAQAWRPSLLAGFMGALASQFWFLAFALTTAANVRTVGLVEVLFAQAVSHFVFGQRTTPREAAGIILIVAGVAFLLLAQ